MVGIDGHNLYTVEFNNGSKILKMTSRRLICEEMLKNTLDSFSPKLKAANLKSLQSFEDPKQQKIDSYASATKAGAYKRLPPKAMMSPGSIVAAMYEEVEEEGDDDDNDISSHNPEQLDDVHVVDLDDSKQKKDNKIWHQHASSFKCSPYIEANAK